jgi:hypothetical protein
MSDEPEVPVAEDEEWCGPTPLPRIPTVDQDDPGDVPYPDYVPSRTKVVSGPVGPAKKYPGTAFPSKRAAMAYWNQRAGRIIEDLSVPGRWIFRVRRDA